MIEYTHDKLAELEQRVQTLERILSQISLELNEIKEAITDAQKT
jgi:uncharacterized protein YukE